MSEGIQRTLDEAIQDNAEALELCIEEMKDLIKENTPKRISKMVQKKNTKYKKNCCVNNYIDGEWEAKALVYYDTVYYDTVAWMPIPSFDDILEANRDVLERIKQKGD